MAMLLYIIGAIAVMVGAVTVAFGVPINEFSFGNTLIVSGSVVGTGGLIIIAIAVAVARLNRIAEALGERALPHEAVPEARAAAMPFPPRTRPVEPPSEPAIPEPVEPPGFPPPFEPHAEEAPAPSLPNPEAAEEAPPPLPASMPPPMPASMPPPMPPPAANFDAMWPEPAKPPAAAEPEPELAEPEPAAEPPPRAVAILKSGVVDGMGYTLYVDGSIEAELPQGTLRFASIDDLRAHLEKGG